MAGNPVWGHRVSSLNLDNGNLGVDGTVRAITDGFGFPTAVSISTDTLLINAGCVLRVHDLTSSQAVFSDVYGNLVSKAITGTVNVVMSNSPALTGTITAAAANFSGAVGIIAATATVTRGGIGTTSTDAFIATNTTAAAAGAQQWSGRMHWSGRGWKTDTTAGSQVCDWVSEIQPAQGTAHPTNRLVFSYQVPYTTTGGGYLPGFGFEVGTAGPVIKIADYAGNYGQCGSIGDDGAGGLTIAALSGINATAAGNGMSFSSTSGGGMTVSQGVSTGSPSSVFAIYPAAHTALSASAQYSILAVSNTTLTWATGGTVASQGDCVFNANTYVSAGTTTFTSAATIIITAAPVAGSGVTFTNGPYALWVKSGLVKMDGAANVAGTVVSGLLYAFKVTTAGSYTGSSGTYAGQFANSVAGTNQSIPTPFSPGGNTCLEALSSAATAGFNRGAFIKASGSTAYNVGANIGAVGGTVAVGVVGAAISGTNASAGVLCLGSTIDASALDASMANSSLVAIGNSSDGSIAKFCRANSPTDIMVDIDYNGLIGFPNSTSGAGAGIGTLTNAPAAGNPQFWVPIKIGATAYWVPAWHA